MGAARKILFASIVLIIIMSFVHANYNAKTGFFGYVGDTGLQLYENNDGIKKSGKLDIAQFYKDMLKIQGEQEIIGDCMNKENFRECINGHYSNDAELQKDYDRRMKKIRNSVDTAKDHGIDYGSVPFLRDLIAD